MAIFYVILFCLCSKNLSRSLAGANSQRSKRTHRSINSSSARKSETSSVDNAQFLLGRARNLKRSEKFAKNDLKCAESCTLSKVVLNVGEW